ncbi:MAG: IPTL-CTERM sorting domain-containing protein [Halieaceae bacterium]
MHASPAHAQIYGASCPAGIDINDCVANDLQPTGTIIINGPSECNEGDIFSATVRILFSDGGGANERYTVGFFVGENGEPAVGGASCTFDSLQPVVLPPDDNPLGGPYPELSGDSCGDISKREPTFKDISLNAIECKDDDGDGNVDISYVLSWENNAKNTDCDNPLDPLQFEPNPPKCRSDLEYDLPIAVEDPPSIEVAKGAFPSQVEEPGGLVRFAITVLNTSPEPTDPVEIVSFIDRVDGGPPQDVNGLLDCVVPFFLAPGESKTCYFESPVNGVSGDVVTDTITVAGRDDEGQGVEDSDSAQVQIIAPDLPPPPGDLRLVKFASPTEIDEPGGTVQYDVLIANVSPTPVELESLEDDLYGDLNGKGSCVLPQTLSGVNSLYFCAFKEQVTGQPGDRITDTIVVSGTDGLPARNALTAQDSATVTIDNVGSNILVTKIANPEALPEPGGAVAYTLAIQNTSPVDNVTINRIFDSLAFIKTGVGLPVGCSEGQTLAPDQSYECTYTLDVEGDSGDSVTNVVEVSGRDDDGRLAFDIDAASVFIVGQPPQLEVVKRAVPSFLPEAGGEVTYIVAIQNNSTSTDPVTITGLTDSVDGAMPVSLDGMGTCSLDPPIVLQPAPGANSFYICSFPQTLGAGTVGDTVMDEIEATGIDDEGTPASATAQETVTYIGSAIPDLELAVAKIASPTEVPEPGDQVTFSVFIANTSDPNTPAPNLTLRELDDSIYGDLFVPGKGDCSALKDTVLVPATSALDVARCSFTENVTGTANQTVTNVIIATAEDASNNEVIGSDDATVTIVDVPASLEVTKRATPVTVIEPGEDVTFDILVFNTSPADRLLLTSLVDNVHGDLLNNGLCPPPPTLFPGRDPYRCKFTVFVGGEPGFEERNTVLAIAEDDEGKSVEGNAQATVTVIGTAPSILTTKTANPTSVPATGGLVSFTFTTTNTSDADVVTLDTLQDNVFGDLNGQGSCSVPQVLAPGESYSCVFSTSLSGILGETHLDEVTATGVSDDGEPVASRANAIVVFVGMVQSIPALGQAGLLSLTVLIGWLGWRRLRRHQ